MHIAMLYGAWGVGNRLFDFQKLWSDPRGLTGSEVSFFSMARGLVKLGHQVDIYTRQKSGVRTWEGCNVYDVASFNDNIENPVYDGVCSWNEPDLLRLASPKSVRLINQQLNDFTYCEPEFDKFVDVYTSPSSAHMEYIRTHTPSPDKWTVLNNGCDPSIYSPEKKVSGRVIYASSPDRGLHHLLQIWPKIKRAVPHAHLRIFYNFAPWYEALKNATFHPSEDLRECAHRAMYIKEAMHRLRNHGVEHLHSISREKMVDEMSEAEVLAYPCDTVRYTEGFSVTLMEACASGTIPITTSVDSLGSIYGGVIPMVEAPVGEHLDEFADNVIAALTDESFRKEVLEDTVVFAENFTWDKLTARLESLLIEGLARKSQ